MEYLIIGIIAATASLLTFFSGFGLGTILTPAFMLFFPIDVAIALTGIVHLLNNLFKLGLIGKHINTNVLWRFGLPAMATAFAGAWLLTTLASFEPIFNYEFIGKSFSISPVNITITLLMLTFAMFELSKKLNKIQFGKYALIPGGLLSGFFGGLSGHQGALRTMFLIKCGLSKESFIATGVAIACLVDVSRLFIYFEKFDMNLLETNYVLLLTATLSAFGGAYFGRVALKKITLGFVQKVVAVMIIILAVLLGTGVLEK
ncbi:MAG: hypothetical protein COA57_12075 [Flavobacteriales bacterium]|nr:MAG: hypothetical protein COA57_12075 [Flavobacteriales bacterium]